MFWFRQKNEKGELINDEAGVKAQLAQSESLLNSITAEWGAAQRGLMTKILSDRQITLEGKIVFRREVFQEKLKAVLDLRYFKAAGGQTIGQRISSDFPITDLTTFCDFLKTRLHDIAATEKVPGDIANLFHELEERSA